MPTIIATPGAATANSFCTKAEADAYYDERLPLPTPWEDAESPERALIMATRVLSRMGQPFKSFVKDGAYYITRPVWTGHPATTTQRLAWPRTGMYNTNGVASPITEIPYELKEATAELAGQLVIADTTLDNDVAVKGIRSISAGSVSLSFKDAIDQHVLPDAVLNLMPASWFEPEAIDYAVGDAEFSLL